MEAMIRVTKATWSKVHNLLKFESPNFKLCRYLCDAQCNIWHLEAGPVSHGKKICIYGLIFKSIWQLIRIQWRTCIKWSLFSFSYFLHLSLQLIVQV